jgi:hypothetical protein
MYLHTSILCRYKRWGGREGLGRKTEEEKEKWQKLRMDMEEGRAEQARRREERAIRR